MLLVCCCTPGAQAKPELQSVFLSFGKSRALAANTWATLSYVLRNPDAKSVTLRLRLLPEDGGTAIFEYEVTVPGKRFIHGREMVTVAPCQKYRMEVFQGTRKLTTFEALTAYSDPLSRCQAFFLDDNPSFEGVSELGRTPELLERVSQTKISAAKAPTHWAGYDDSRVVVIGAPDFRYLGSDRCAALIEYVHRGGTVVFISPAGTLAAAHTPLADILPVTPLRVRLVEVVPELDGWGATAFGPKREREPFASPDGIPFLESTPKDEGVSTLTHGDFPVIRWRSIGLGRVGVIAVDPCGAIARNSGCFLAVWNHILSWAQAPYSLSYRENNTRVPALMAQLTGHRIPGVRPVAALLFGYAALVTILLIVGYALRRHATAWIAAAALGFLATGLVFIGAYRANSHRPRRGAAVLTLTTASGTRTASQAVVSLQSRSDARPTLVGQAADTLIRGLPAVTRDKRKQSGDAPVLVHRASEISSTPKINVAALKPRSIAAISSPPPLPTSHPRLTMGTDSITVAATDLPDWLPPNQLHAFAILPNAIRPLRLGDGQIQGLASDRAALRLDPFLTGVSELVSSGRFPSPAVAFVHPFRPGTDPLPLDLTDFTAQGYAIQFIPMRASAPAGEIEIPATCIRVVPRGNVTRMYLTNRDLCTVRRPEFFLEFDVVLPAWMIGVQPDSVEAIIDARNPGGNLVTTVRLAPSGQRGHQPGKAKTLGGSSASWLGAIEATSSNGSTHAFQSLPPTLFSPITGQCRLVLRLTQKQLVRNPIVAERLNSWRFGSIQIRLTGQLPEQREF